MFADVRCEARLHRGMLRDGDGMWQELVPLVAEDGLLARQAGADVH
jgi:hypothetical protein